jgi:GT2 family glycosyltransferase
VGEVVLPVYVIHYNAPEWCRETVESLKRSDVPVSVTVVSNGGDTSGIDARVLELGDNRGYAGAANVAIDDSGDSPFLLVTSHDVTVEPDTVRRLLEAAHTHPTAGILGASVGGGGKVELGRDGGVRWLHWTSGTCLLLRKECLKQIGTFDERFHSYVEDADIGHRVVDAGWKVGKVGNARAVERGSSAGSSFARRQTYANASLLAYKRGGWPAFARSVGGMIHLAVKVFALGVRSPRHLGKQSSVAVDYLSAIGIAMRRLPRFET